MTAIPASTSPAGATPQILPKGDLEASPAVWATAPLVEYQYQGNSEGAQTVVRQTVRGLPASGTYDKTAGKITDGPPSFAKTAATSLDDARRLAVQRVNDVKGAQAVLQGQQGEYYLTTLYGNRSADDKTGTVNYNGWDFDNAANNWGSASDVAFRPGVDAVKAVVGKYKWVDFTQTGQSSWPGDTTNSELGPKRNEWRGETGIRTGANGKAEVVDGSGKVIASQG